MTKALALIAIFAAVSFARAADDASSSFVRIRLVRCWEDGAGNVWEDIVVSNTHDYQVIRASVDWISIARERGTIINLEPGEEKVIARDQANARDVRVVEAHFK